MNAPRSITKIATTTITTPADTIGIMSSGVQFEPGSRMWTQENEAWGSVTGLSDENENAAPTKKTKTSWLANLPPFPPTLFYFAPNPFYNLSLLYQYNHHRPESRERPRMMATIYDTLGRNRPIQMFYNNTGLTLIH